MTAAIARSTILFFIVIICGRTEQNRPDLAGYVKHLYRKIELHRRSLLKKSIRKGEHRDKKMDLGNDRGYADQRISE